MVKVLYAYDATSKGAVNYINLANEILKNRIKMAKATKKQALGRGLSALLKETKSRY